MTHLNITQGSTVETVSAQIIKKLYEIALTVSEPLEDETDAAYMSGHITVPSTYKEYVDYLAGTVGEGSSGVVTSTRQNAGGRFQNLTIDVTNGYYIPFEDPNMLQYLLDLGIGSNGAITTAQAAAVTSTVANSVNTTITKFNELKYFTNITSSKGGYGVASSGACKFYHWTALQEVDISNFVSLGHNNGYAYEDTFCGCTSLKKVTASNKLTSLGYSAFYGCSNLEEITGLPNEITLYGPVFKGCAKLPQSFFTPITFNLYNVAGSGNDFIFEGCSLLTDINLSNTVTLIPQRAFFGTGLNTINGSNTVPQNITAIGDSAFKNTNIAGALYLPNCTIIDADAFSGCKLTSVNLPSLQTIGNTIFFNNPITTITSLGNVTSLRNNVFEHCTSLTSADLTGITSFGNKVFKDCSNLETITGLSGEISIGSETFRNCTKLKSSNFTNVQFLVNNNNLPLNYDYYTFDGCSTLTSLQFSTNCTLIPKGMFNNCPSLTTITGLSNITRVGRNAFGNDRTGTSALTTVDIDWSKITTIGVAAFANCGLSGTINLPNVTDIEGGSYTFYKMVNATSITLGSGVTQYGQYMFSQSGITSVVIPSRITDLGIRTYNMCTNLTTVTFENNTSSATRLPTSMFGLCSSLQSVIVGEGITTIGAEAFGETPISTLVLPSTVTTMEQQILSRSWSLTELTIKATTPPTCSNTFNNSPFYSSGIATTIYVPNATAKAAYEADSYWGSLPNNTFAIIPNS